MRPEVGWVSLKLLMECETPASDESARERAVVHDVEGEAAATERAASDRARKLRASAPRSVRLFLFQRNGAALVFFFVEQFS